jgi:hypothetical protein
MSFLFLFPKMTQSELAIKRIVYQQFKLLFILSYTYKYANICIHTLIYYNYWLYLYKFKRLNIYLCH